MIQGLAKYDEFDVVKKVQEISLEFLAPTPEIMLTGLQSAITLCRPKHEWAEGENVQIEKITSSIITASLAMKKRLNIRYLAKSESCLRIANAVNVVSGEFNFRLL